MKQFLWLLTAAVVLSACTSSPSPTLDVANGAAPVISRFGASPTSGTAPLAVRFFWSISDANRDLMSCELDVSYDGNTFTPDYSVGLPRTRTSNCTSSSRINHTFGPGIHTVALRVCDGANCTIRTQVITVTPNPNNRPPVIANFVANPNPAGAGLSTTFSWTTSDPENSPITCTFDPDTSTSGNETTVPCNQTHNHTYTSAGTFTARLSVSDGVNPPVGANVSVSVINNPPLLSGFAANPNPVQVNNATTFSWTTSDPENNPITCTFDPDTSTSGNETTVPCNQTHNHTYTSAGTFTAQLSVSDGANPSVSSSVEVEVVNGFTQISTGENHTCALSPTGQAYCWGYNFYGQLGNGDSGTDANTNTPQLVSGGHTFSQISAGESHTCALTPTGQAYCWGLNGNGQLGNGNNTNANTPQLVSGSHVFSQISSSTLHTCALTPTGQAYCWGNNVYSQLGNGNSGFGTNANTPQAVAMPSGITFSQISGGAFHTCALTSTNQAYCWGFNFFGQLGNGNNADANTPQAVTMPSGITFSQIGGGSAHTCALTPTNQAYCWGYDDRGQLGKGDNTDANTPQLVSVGHVFSQIGGGSAHTCALTPTNQTYCWGYNFYSQLGNGNITDANTPQLVSMPPGVAFSQISTGGLHTCALTPTGQAYCWGRNNYGQLGNGNNTDANTPQAVVMP